MAESGRICQYFRLCIHKVAQTTKERPERRSTVRREPAVGNLRPQKKLSKQQEPLKKQLNNKAQLEKSNFKLNENAVTGRSRGPGLRPARMLAGRGDGDDKGCVVC